MQATFRLAQVFGFTELNENHSSANCGAFGKQESWVALLLEHYGMERSEAKQKQCG
jgi:hypothetical protein